MWVTILVHYYISLIAKLVVFVCLQVAILGECSEDTIETSYHYGRNVGIAFQVGV